MWRRPRTCCGARGSGPSPPRSRRRSRPVPMGPSTPSSRSPRLPNPWWSTARSAPPKRGWRTWSGNCAGPGPGRRTARSSAPPTRRSTGPTPAPWSRSRAGGSIGWPGRRRRSRRKLTLFWHGHFTTSFGDVQDAVAIATQNQLFRQHAAGNFARLLDGLARDPAMLRYLNNDANRKGHPNENWARELMELFTLGIGHYTEIDIRESARAWTGWTLADGRTFEGRRAFGYNPRLHDDGVKTFLGQTGAFDGTDIMRILLSTPAAPRWIAGRLAKFFVSPTPDPDLVEAMAQSLVQHRYEIAPVLRAMFR